MGQFLQIIKEYDKSQEANGQGLQLTKFFGVLQHFNKGKKFNLELKHKMEAYFEYRWACDRNFVFVSE